MIRWLLLLACTGDLAGKSVEAVVPGLPATLPAAAFFDRAGTFDLPPCREVPPARRIDRTLTVRLLRGPGVPDLALQAETRRLQAFFAPLGLTFVADGPAREVDEPWLLADPPPGATSPATEAVAPLRAFLVEHATPATDRVVIAMLPRIAEPGSWADRAFDVLRGLTLSPHLDSRDEAGAIRTALAIEVPFTPTILLSRDDLANAAPFEAPVTLPHELGHALGLHHTSHPHDLMASQPARCLPVLTTEQSAAFTRALDASP